MRSMFADQPYSEVVRASDALEISSTLSPSTSFISFVSGSNSAFNSSSFFFSSSSSTSRPSLVVDFNFFPIEFLELLDSILVDGVHHVKHLQSLLPQCLQEGRGRDCRDTVARDVVDVVLPFLHPVHVLLQTPMLVAGLRRVIPHELSNLRPICRIFVDAELDVLRELLVELLVVILLLGNLCKHLQAFLDQVLFDHAPC